MPGQRFVFAHDRDMVDVEVEFRTPIEDTRYDEVVPVVQQATRDLAIAQMINDPQVLKDRIENSGAWPQDIPLDIIAVEISGNP